MLTAVVEEVRQFSRHHVHHHESGNRGSELCLKEQHDDITLLVAKRRGT
jgi:hypothetical protein